MGKKYTKFETTETRKDKQTNKTKRGENDKGGFSNVERGF